MDLTCSICGDPLNKLFSHKLGCGHEFHYECLQKSFICMKNNNCPYCRSGNNLLPLVNGLKKINICVHDTTNVSEFENVRCKTIMKSGKRKNEECGANCKLGYFYCSRHLKI